MASYTKIDVAEAQIKCAVRLFFEDSHPIPVYTLACSAREIMTTLGEKLGVPTAVDELAKIMKAEKSDVYRRLHQFAGFMKHADRNPTATLEAFSDLDNDPVLFIAGKEFARVADGMPIESQVFEAWYYATKVERVAKGPVKWQRAVKACIRAFPRVRSVERKEQKRIALTELERALRDPRLEMKIKRTVELAGLVEGPN